MKRCIKRCLRAGLIVCGLWSGLVFALDANKADIGFVTTINGNNVMHGTINSGGKGCSAGQYWDIVVGGCTSPVNLRTESTSRGCDCSCPGAGSCSASQSGTYPVFGWRIPTSGAEQISHYGETSWGACSMTSNQCEAVVPPAGPGGDGSTPSAGTVWQVTIYICDSSNVNWYSGVANLSDAQKSRFVQTYRNFNVGSRCPESFGYTGWQGTWNLWANQLEESQGYSHEDALEQTWPRLRAAMIDAAATNKENTPEFQQVMNDSCTSYARSLYGSSTLTAIYVMGSGDKCQIL